MTRFKNLDILAYSTLAVVAVVACGVFGPAGCSKCPPAPAPNPDVTPQPAPAPPPPAPVGRLAADMIAVIDSAADALVIASPDGLVSVVSEAGPVKVSGKFLDGNGKHETKTFKGKQVTTVSPVASGRVELIVVPAGATDPTKVTRRTVDVESGDGPRPPPGPGPGPTPPPPSPVKPPPIPAPGLHVLMTYDAAKLPAMPPGQQNVIFSKAVRDYLDAHCPFGPDGKTHEWRIWQSSAIVGEVPKLWRDAFARPRAADNWIVVSNPDRGGGTEEPLPATVDDALKLLKKYGGD